MRSVSETSSDARSIWTPGPSPSQRTERTSASPFRASTHPYLSISPLTQMSYYPAVCLKNASISVRFAAPFAHLPPDCLPLPQEETPVPAGPRSLLALILEPTRELAQQTFECLEHFRQYMSHPAVNVVRAGNEWDVGAADWRGTNRLEEAEEASGSQSHRGGDDEWAFHWGVK